MFNFKYCFGIANYMIGLKWIQKTSYDQNFLKKGSGLAWPIEIYHQRYKKELKTTQPILHCTRSQKVQKFAPLQLN